MNKTEAIEVVLSEPVYVHCECGCNANGGVRTVINPTWAEAHVVLGTMSRTEALAVYQSLGVGYKLGDLALANYILISVYCKYYDGHKCQVENLKMVTSLLLYSDSDFLRLLREDDIYDESASS